jgi:hypothetical protein
MAFNKINTRFLQRPPDGTKPWWFQNSRVDIFLWTLSNGDVRMIQCANQETDLGTEEAYADWRPGKGVRIGMVQGRMSSLSLASPSVDFTKIPSLSRLRRLVDRAEECLTVMPESMRGQVVAALTEMRSRIAEVKK